MNQLALIDEAGLPTLDAARSARNHGMQVAIDHAEDRAPGWGDVAYQFLVRYAASHCRFISEDVSDASKKWGMVQPPTDRAWGSVYRKAVRNGVIAQDGVGRSRRRHASICPMWRSLVFREAA